MGDETRSIRQNVLGDDGGSIGNVAADVAKGIVLKMFHRWITHPARWYQFWWPQSALLGGVILGLLLTRLIIWIIK